MFTSRMPGCCLLCAAALLTPAAQAAGDAERCISRQHQPTGVGLGRTPAAIRELAPLVSLPAEGRLKLGFPSSDCCSDWVSPTGDLTAVAGPYDPERRRLYLWGFDTNGWIEVDEVAGTWMFGAGGTIEPRLYEPADDIEDVTAIARSEVLGLQFYSGFTAPHWLTGRQSYRVYRISGPEMTRVPELEAGNLHYVGDDPAAGLAVFAPVGASWANSPDVLPWYDGSAIVAPPAGLPPPSGLCRQPGRGVRHAPRTSRAATPSPNPSPPTPASARTRRPRRRWRNRRSRSPGSPDAPAR